MSRAGKRFRNRSALAVVMMAASSVSSATIDWTNNSGGTFNDPANWNSAAGPVPTSGDTAHFNLPGTFTTTFDTSLTNDALLIEQGAISFAYEPSASRTYTLNSATINGANLTLASPGSGTKTFNLILNGGALRLDNAQLTINKLTGFKLLGDVWLGTTSPASVTITAASTAFSQTGTAAMMIGAATGAPSTFTMAGGTFVTGIGGLYVNPTGVFNVTAGTVTINGDSMVDGGSVNAPLSVASGKSLTVRNGAQVTTSSFVNKNGTLRVESGAQYTANSGGTISSGETVDIAGATVIANDDVQLIYNTGPALPPGQIILTGPGSVFTQTQSNARTLEVGSRIHDRALGIITVNSGGVFTTGTGDITVWENGVINVTGGTFNAHGNVINGNVIQVQGAGASFVQTGAKALTIAVGRGDGDALLSVSNGGAFTTGTGAILIDPTGELKIDGGAFNAHNTVVARGALSIANGGKIDLFDNDMIIANLSYSAVESLVKAGFGNFDWLGSGITSTTAATFAQGDGSRAMGVLRAGDWGYTVFSGQTVSANDVIVKFTWTGDTNCDGLVDNDDFGQFLYGFNGGGSPKWLNGDFDYSGVVDNDDFGAFLTGMAAFNASGGTQLSESFKSELAAFATANGIPMVLPEPAVLMPLALIGMLARRRRR